MLEKYFNVFEDVFKEIKYFVKVFKYKYLSL